MILFCSCAHTGTIRNEDFDLQKIFKEWNLTTSKSISAQRELVSNETQKELYGNRLDALKSYLAIDDFSHFNDKSIRFKFLKNWSKDWGKDFYIIEANDSGEKTSILSYVVTHFNKSSKVLKFKYFREKWMKVDEYNISTEFNYRRENYLTSFGNGQNENDIVVTHFGSGKILNSDFFLFSTMSLITAIKQIFTT